MNKLGLLFMMSVILYAGTVGKISGRVMDIDAGMPLAGVNVMVPSLQIGGASDQDGYYYILNVPPGQHEIEASMIGYQCEIKQEVEVYADRTTYANFELNQAIVEIECPVIVVVAKKPVIDIDMTSKEARITRSDLDNIPVETPTEAIALQGGVTTDAAGDIHIRGGRGGELAYYVEGIEVSNALLGSAPTLSKNLISEMSFLSGTFNAEYGNIMSGVVNIVTPEGSERIASGLEYTSFMVNSSPYRQADWAGDSSDSHRDSLGNSLYQAPDLLTTKDLPFLGEVNAYFRGPIPFDRNTRFYVAGNYANQESYLPFGYELIRAANGKLTRRFGPNLKLLLDLQYTNSEGQGYSHAYKYLSENYLVNYTKNFRMIFGLNHAPTNNFFYNLRLGYVAENIESSVPGLDEETIIEPVTDNYSEFYVSGYPIFRQEAETKQSTLKADFNLQAGRIHSFKFGLEGELYRFNLANRAQLFPRAPIDYQDYEVEPRAMAVFLQDKIEHQYLVVNAGVRFDYSDPNITMWNDIEDPESEITDVDPSYQVSPRLGLSHPITENAMLHFAYGHFFQVPPYEIMYYNQKYVVYPESMLNYSLIGNPRIEPQRTTAYEVGIKYVIQEIYGIDITLFLKDIRNLLATTEVRVFPYDYIIYSNEDFASVQGIDLTLRREMAGSFSFSVNYTYQVARGNRSFSMQGFYDVYEGQPERMDEYFLDFDRRHTLAANVEALFNDLGGIGVNLKAASGLPYTPYISEGVVVEANSARMDWEYSLDVIIHQGFRLGMTTVDFFVRGTNLTDHLNPRYVYARTGEPWDSGEELGGLMGSFDYIMDPSNVGPRRTIKAGMRVRI